MRALYESPFRPALEEKYGRLLFLNIELELKTFKPEIIGLLQEENALTTAYTKLSPARATLRRQGVDHRPARPV